MKRSLVRRAPAILAAPSWILFGAALGLGCTYQRYVTETPRSATEQLLVHRAAERALDALTWPDLEGRAVAVEVAALNGADAPYAQALAEARARTLGARVVALEQAEWVLVLLAGGLGTASRNTSFGVPALPIPGGSTPEIPFARVLKQRGYAQLRLVAHDRSGASVADSEGVLGRASFETYSLFFLVIRRNDIYPGEQSSFGID